MRTGITKYITLLLGTLCLVFLVACNGSAATQSTLPTATVRVSREPEWFFPDHVSNIAIFVVDYQTLELETAYTMWQTQCSELRPPVSDEELKQRASGLFNALGDSWGCRIDETTGECTDLGFEVSHTGDFAILELDPSDFGGFAVLHPCSGLVVYAGSIIWAGTGAQFFPAVPTYFDISERATEKASPPRALDVVIGPGGTPDESGEKNGMAAWNSIKDRRLVYELASRPYSVLVYLYPRGVGVFQPEYADWVIFVHQGTSPTQFAASPAP